MLLCVCSVCVYICGRVSIAPRGPLSDQRGADVGRLMLVWRQNHAREEGSLITHLTSHLQPKHMKENAHTNMQMAAAMRSFCKLFPLLIHRSPFPAFVNFVHTLLSSSSCLSFVLLSGFLSGLMKYITRVLLSLVENACCIKWIDCLWLIFMVRARRMYGQRGDGMWWRLKRGQILQLPPNWFPLVWWRE